MIANYALAVCLVISATTASHQTYPGTAKRPILSDTEAEFLSESNYLQGWTVEPISIPENPDYIVGRNQTYNDIQAAVNAAIEAGSNNRTYIEIQPGTYEQTVFIDESFPSIPLTIYGSGASPSEVLITLSQGDSMNSTDWIKQVNPKGNRYVLGDPAYSMYNKCASKNGTIGTTCTSIFWIKNDNVQVYNLQVTNSFRAPGTAQAVALNIDADEVHLSDLNLISRQDTVYFGSESGSKIEPQRVYVENCYIEGDVDFVFGGASVVFNQTTFYAVSDRHESATVFAPSTQPDNSFGFLVMNSFITADKYFQSTKHVRLARSWDEDTVSGEYAAGTSPNGQLTIRNTHIDPVINIHSPYANYSTSHRLYSANIDPKRNLNNNNFNRFWEYQNTGDGAQK